MTDTPKIKALKFAQSKISQELRNPTLSIDDFRILLDVSTGLFSLQIEETVSHLLGELA